MSVDFKLKILNPRGGEGGNAVEFDLLGEI
jgi:hypothetical protein